MTELDKWQKVNSCETIEELEQCILDFADLNGQIQGRTRSFDAEEMARGASLFYNDEINSPNVVTREFGLRQQLLYLKHYS